MQTALITGATSGIGKAYAYALARKGINLILTGRRREVITQVAKDIRRQFGVDVTVCIVDFSKTKQLNEFINFINTLSSIDYLINNVGYGLEGSFLAESIQNNLDMIEVHNTSTIRLCHLIGRKMKAQHSGTIINVSSLAGQLILPKSALYCSTKAFLTNFSQSLALELKPYGIKVQVLCPGFVHTDFHSKLAIDAKDCKDKGPIKWMAAADVVRYSLTCLDNPWQVICIPGGWNRLLYHFIKWIPKSMYYKLVIGGIPFVKGQ